MLKYTILRSDLCQEQLKNQFAACEACEPLVFLLNYYHYVDPILHPLWTTEIPRNEHTVQNAGAPDASWDVIWSALGAGLGTQEPAPQHNHMTEALAMTCSCSHTIWMEQSSLSEVVTST